MQGQTAGFTIIELMLFLAISGLLLLMMFTGTGMIASRQRFSDSTDSLQVFFQSQYDEVLNGVNSRNPDISCASDGVQAAAPGKSQCLLLGKLLTVSADGTTIKASYVISTEPTDQLSTEDEQVKLQDAKLQVVTNGQTDNELKWGAAVSESTRSTGFMGGSGRSQVNSIAFIRVPDSDQILQLYYRDISGDATQGLNDTLADTDAYNPPANTSGPSLAICLKNDNDFAVTSPRSAIVFGQGKGAGSITTNYEPGALCSL